MDYSEAKKAKVIRLSGMGFVRREIARIVKLTPAQVGSIIRTAAINGKGYKVRRSPEDRSAAKVAEELLDSGHDPRIVAANFPEHVKMEVPHPGIKQEIPEEREEREERPKKEPPQNQQPDAGANYMPTAEEIQAAAAEIREGWSERTHVHRMVGFGGFAEYEIPEIADPWQDY